MSIHKISIGITGHKGVIGSEFIRRNKNFNFIRFKGDIANQANVDRWIRNNSFQAILHFAAIVPIKKVERNFLRAKKVNYNGTKNLVDAIIKYRHNNLVWFFYASTSHVYKDSNKKIKENDKRLPITRYGLTKLMAENYILQKKKYTHVQFCIGRVFSFFHHKQKSSYFIQNAYRKIYQQNNKNIFFTGLQQYRDVLGVRDICEAINFLHKKRAVGIYNVASGKKTKLLEIIKILLNKKKIKITTNRITRKNLNLIANVDKINSLGWSSKQNINQILKEYLKNKRN